MGKNKKFFENKKHIKETKIGTKEHNNRQNVNICIGNLDTNKERQKAIEHFFKGKCTEEFQAQYMGMKKKIGGY